MNKEIEGNIKAFGLDIISQYNRSGEIIEMINFCQLINARRLQHCIKEIYYESEHDICNIEIHLHFRENKFIKDLILQFASDTLHCYMINRDKICTGNYFNEVVEDSLKYIDGRNMEATNE